MKFIFKTVLTSFLLFTLYTIFLFAFPKFQNHLTTQSWWQENKIKAENFYFQKQKSDIIMVGTSMSEGLKLNPDKRSALTLNFIGGSSLTGLELVKRSSLLPKILIIETNWLERPLDYNLIADVTSTGFEKIISITPSLLESNKPANVLASMMNLGPSFIDNKKEKEHFIENLNQKIKAENEHIDIESVEKEVKNVATLVYYFREKGVQVYLMELPMHKELYTTKRFTATKLTVNKFLNEIDSIPKFKTQPLETSDGYHFTTASKKIYINYLTTFLNQL